MKQTLIFLKYLYLQRVAMCVFANANDRIGCAIANIKKLLTTKKIIISYVCSSCVVVKLIIFTNANATELCAHIYTTIMCVCVYFLGYFIRFFNFFLLFFSFCSCVNIANAIHIYFFMPTFNKKRLYYKILLHGVYELY